MTEAVRKASAQAAEIFRLDDRGVLREGSWADIVIFDLEKIEDQASYDDPFAEPSGIQYVIVNGAVTVDHGAIAATKPAGMILKRKHTLTHRTN